MPQMAALGSDRTIAAMAPNDHWADKELLRCGCTDGSFVAHDSVEGATYKAVGILAKTARAAFAK